jgi:putative PIN family toxin of toxin-antitoxin system
MKVIIDTNVVVSAVLRDRDPEIIILFVAERPEFQWIASGAIIQEYKDVLARDRFALPKDLLQKWHGVIDSLTSRVEVDVRVDFPRDRKDAKFIECALACEADYLITGDKDFSEAQQLIGTTIISVSLFKRLVCDAWSKS